MTHATFDNGIDVLRRSHNITILLPRRPSTDAIAGAVTLAHALETLKKDVRTILVDPLPDQLLALPVTTSIRPSLDSARAYQAEFTLARPDHLQSLEYERRGNNVILHLATSAPLSRPPAQWAVRRPVCDCLIFMGISSQAERDAALGDHRDLAASAATLLFTTKLHTEPLADASFTIPHAHALCETAAAALDRLGFAIDGNTATSLLAGIFSATDARRASFPHPLTARRAAWLIRRGADRRQATAMAEGPRE